MEVLHTRNVPAQVRFLVDALASNVKPYRYLTIQQMPWDRGVMAACLALNEVGRGSSPRGPNQSLSQNRLGEGDSPILLRRLRKIGTVPDGFDMYLWRSLAAHHLAMVKAPVQIRLGTLPAG